MFNFNIGLCDIIGIFVSVISILALLFVGSNKGYSWALSIIFFIKTARILVEISSATWSSSGKSWSSFLSLCQCRIRRCFRSTIRQTCLLWWAYCRLALSSRQETWSHPYLIRFAALSVDSIIIYSHRWLSIWIAHIIMFTWPRISSGTWSGTHRRRFPSF